MSFDDDTMHALVLNDSEIIIYASHFSSMEIVSIPPVCHKHGVGGGGNPPKLELTGGRPGGDFLVNLGPKTLNNMGSSCEKKCGHRRFSISTFVPV